MRLVRKSTQALVFTFLVVASLWWQPVLAAGGQENSPEISNAMAEKIFQSMTDEERWNYLAAYRAVLEAYERENPMDFGVQFYHRWKVVGFLLTEFIEEACASTRKARVKGGKTPNKSAVQTSRTPICAGFITDVKMENTFGDDGSSSEKRKNACVSDLKQLEGSNQEVDYKPEIETTKCENDQVVCNPLLFCYDLNEKKVLCVDKQGAKKGDKSTITQKCNEALGNMLKNMDEGGSAAGRTSAKARDTWIPTNLDAKGRREVSEEEIRKKAEETCGPNMFPEQVGSVANTGWFATKWRNVRCVPKTAANVCGAFVKKRKNVALFNSLRSSINHNDALCKNRGTGDKPASSTDIERTCFELRAMLKNMQDRMAIGTSPLNEGIK